MKLHQVAFPNINAGTYKYVVRHAQALLKEAENAVNTAARLKMIAHALDTLRQLVSTLGTDMTIDKARASSQREDHQPAKSFGNEDMKKFNEQLIQIFTNATLDVSPYNKTDFRIHILKDLISRIEMLETRLVAQLAIEKAAQ